MTLYRSIHRANRVLDEDEVYECDECDGEGYHVVKTADASLSSPAEAEERKCRSCLGYGMIEGYGLPVEPVTSEEINPMSKHTPGPWTLSTWDAGVVDVDADGWSCLAEVYKSSTRDAEGEANARLIAAAPDQNAALLHIAERIDAQQEAGHYTVELNPGDIEIVRAAIAKAEGGDR